MWGRFRRKRDRRREAIEQALSALESALGRLGMLRAKHTGGGTPYGTAIGPGISILLVIILISLSFWLLRRRARETASTTSVPEEGEEARQPTFPSKRPGRVLRVFVKYPTHIYRGRLANVLAARRELLLTTTGRKSGLPRTTPLNFIKVDGAYVIAAGWGTHADWYQNLLANPEVAVQVGKRRFAARAHLVEEPEVQRELLHQLVRRSWQQDEPPRPVRWFLRTVFGYDYDAVHARAIEHPELVPVIRLVPQGSPEPVREAT